MASTSNVGMQRRAAIYGIPGVGKTQLGIKYLNENRASYKHSFYISARSELAIINDFCRIASICIPQATKGAEPPQKVDAVLQWFCEMSDAGENQEAAGNNEEVAPWIIFYDNISTNDLALVRSRYLPSCKHGHVLFTTRDRTVAEDLVNDDKNGVLHLEKMSEKESVKLILSTSGEGLNSNSETLAVAGEIASSVSGLPIALDQVASFSKRRGISLSDSLERLKLQKSILLSYRSPNSKYETNNSTTAMIQVALKDANEKFKGAGLFFKILCFFGQEYVPISFLTGNGKSLPSLKDIIYDSAETLSREPSRPFQKTTLSEQTTEYSDSDEMLLSSLFSDIYQVEAAIDALKSTGIVQQTEKVLWIHDLFSATGADEIAPSQKYTILCTAQRITSRVFSDPDYPNLPDHREYLNFALKIAKNTDTTCHMLRYDLGTFFWFEGNYKESCIWYERALAGFTKALGKDHLSTLHTIHSMAMVFRRQGRYNEALEWYERALAGYEKTLGKDHSSTLTTINNMAIVFQIQGQYDKALEWYERALVGKETVFGKDHLETLDVVHNMGLVFRRQGRYDEALKWHERALTGLEKAFGKDHPETLSTIHSIGMVFQEYRQYDKALEWYERALAGYEKALGKDHPEKLQAIANMASLFVCQDKNDKALEWYERALAGGEKVLGKEHPWTLGTIDNIATLKSRLESASHASVKTLS